MRALLVLLAFPAVLFAAPVPRAKPTPLVDKPVPKEWHHQMTESSVVLAWLTVDTARGYYSHQLLYGLGRGDDLTLYHLTCTSEELHWPKKSNSRPVGLEQIDRKSDEAVAQFLSKSYWSPNLVPSDSFNPKLIDGGVCYKAWRDLFDRDPSPDLFPELKR